MWSNSGQFGMRHLVEGSAMVNGIGPSLRPHHYNVMFDGPGEDSCERELHEADLREEAV